HREVVANRPVPGGRARAPKLPDICHRESTGWRASGAGVSLIKATSALDWGAASLRNPAEGRSPGTRDTYVNDPSHRPACGNGQGRNQGWALDLNTPTNIVRSIRFCDRSPSWRLPKIESDWPFGGPLDLSVLVSFERLPFH